MRGVLAAAAAIAASWTAAAILSARSLEGVPARGRVPMDPTASVAELVALAVTLLAAYRLGRGHVRERDAVRAGALAGLLGGSVAAVAQAVGVGGYLERVLVRYAVPDELTTIALAAYAVVATGAYAAVSAGAAWWGARRGRSRRAAVADARALEAGERRG